MSGSYISCTKDGWGGGVKEILLGVETDEGRIYGGRKK